MQIIENKYLKAAINEKGAILNSIIYKPLNKEVQYQIQKDSWAFLSSLMSANAGLFSAVCARCNCVMECNSMPRFIVGKPSRKTTGEVAGRKILRVNRFAVRGRPLF